MKPRTWKVKSSSVPGTSHRKEGKPCQDAHKVRILESGMLLVAVADGAGSAPFGEEGAKLAVAASVETLENLLLSETDPGGINWSRILQDSLRAARQRLEQEAQTLGAQVREMATTLILVAAAPHFLAAVQVGDGACVGVNVAGCMRRVGKALRGEYVNETVFLTSPGYERSLEMNLWPDQVARVAVFTDGIEMLAIKMPENEPFAPFFKPLWEFADEEMDPLQAEVEMNRFLLSPRIAGRADDDLTLVLASLGPPNLTLQR